MTISKFNSSIYMEILLGGICISESISNPGGDKPVKLAEINYGGNSGELTILFSGRAFECSGVASFVTPEVVSSEGLLLKAQLLAEKLCSLPIFGINAKEVNRNSILLEPKIVSDAFSEWEFREWITLAVFRLFQDIEINFQSGGACSIKCAYCAGKKATT